MIGPIAVPRSQIMALMEPGDPRASMFSFPIEDILLDRPITAARGFFGAVPCLVHSRCEDVVRLIVGADMARTAEVPGDRFYISSARGFDADLARNIAAAWRPEGV